MRRGPPTTPRHWSSPVLGIALVVLLIVWAKMHAFLALTISSLLVGVFSGIALTDVTKSSENGVGGVLGYVGVLIALGAMLGKLLGDSGATGDSAAGDGAAADGAAADGATADGAGQTARSGPGTMRQGAQQDTPQ